MELVRIASGEDEQLFLELLARARESMGDTQDPRGERSRALEAELETAREAQGTVLAAWAGNEWLGFATLVRRDWDSRHFSTEVYRLGAFAHWGGNHAAADHLAAGILGVARTLRAGLVHAWLPLEDIRGLRSLETAGFRLADVLTTFGIGLDHGRTRLTLNEDARVRSAEPGDEPMLVEIANEIYARTPDRFHAEPRFSRAQANAVYAQWILNSCRGQLADDVRVAEVDGKVMGFATVKLDRRPIVEGAARTASIPLVGVARAAEGRGLASQLVNAALCWMENQDVAFGYIGTQANNYPMQRLLPRLGMRVFRVGPSLHRWL